MSDNLRSGIIDIKKKSGGSIVREENVRPYKTPQQKKQMKTLLWVIVAIAALGAAAYFFMMPKEKTYRLRDYEMAQISRGDILLTAQASGTVAVPVQLRILSPEEGYAQKLYVTEGDYVTKGKVLATLTAPGLDEQLEDLEISLGDAERNLEKLSVQNSFSLKKMEREIASLNKDITKSEADVAKLEALVKINISRKSELEGITEQLEDLKDRRDEAEISYNQEKTLQAIDMKIARANITQMNTRIKRLRERMAALSIISPMAGDVLEIDSTLGVAGSYISPNMYLFTIADPSSAIAELELLEDYAGLITEGQEISLSIGGQTLPGTITAIGKIAQVSSDGLGSTVLVKVKPKGSSESFMLGSTVIGTMELGRKENALLLPRGPYLTTGSQKYLYKIEGNSAVRIEVTFGEIRGNTVEIINGASEGDRIIISGYQNFIDYKTIELGKGE